MTLLHTVPEEDAEARDSRDMEVYHGLDTVKVRRIQLLEKEYPCIVDQNVDFKTFRLAPAVQFLRCLKPREVLEARPYLHREL